MQHLLSFGAQQYRQCTAAVAAVSVTNVSPSEKPSHDARGIATTHGRPFTKSNEESMRQRAWRSPLSLPGCPSTPAWPVCTQGSEKHPPNRRAHLRISAHNQASRQKSGQATHDGTGEKGRRCYIQQAITHRTVQYGSSQCRQKDASDSIQMEIIEFHTAHSWPA